MLLPCQYCTKNMPMQYRMERGLSWWMMWMLGSAAPICSAGSAWHRRHGRGNLHSRDRVGVPNLSWHQCKGSHVEGCGWWCLLVFFRSRSESSTDPNWCSKVSDWFQSFVLVFMSGDVVYRHVIFLKFWDSSLFVEFILCCWAHTGVISFHFSCKRVPKGDPLFSKSLQPTKGQKEHGCSLRKTGIHM